MERLGAVLKNIFVVLNFMLTVCGVDLSFGRIYRKRALVVTPRTCTSCVTVHYYPTGNTSHKHSTYVAAYYVS